MKEITRIHLAKVAYDIELAAKKDLERYIDALSTHADEDVMSDIESRMVELLAERHVVAGGVITAEDVVDLRTHLGEPKDFIDENEAESATGREPKWSERRFYRDIDNGLLGGVCSGLAAYFAIDPVLVRVAFVILALLTHVVFVCVYLLLWLIIPPAHTAGQKLQMHGQPITAASIKEFSAHEFTNERIAVIRRFITKGLGIFFLLIAAGVTIALPLGVMGLIEGINRPIGGFDNSLVPTAIIVLGGLMFVWLMLLLADMILAQRFTARRANQIATVGVGFVATVIAYGIVGVTLGF